MEAGPLPAYTGAGGEYVPDSTRLCAVRVQRDSCRGQSDVVRDRGNNIVRQAVRQAGDRCLCEVVGEYGGRRYR
ncbi:hypothetical protein D3C84_1147970 [compost metagenome]